MYHLIVINFKRIIKKALIYNHSKLGLAVPKKTSCKIQLVLKTNIMIIKKLTLA